MTQVSILDSKKGSPTQGKEVFYPATVLAVPNLVVLGLRGYQRGPGGLRTVGTIWAKEFSKDVSRKITVPKKPKSKDLKGEGLQEVRLLVHTKPKEATRKKKPEIFEIAVGGNPEEGLAYAKSKLGQELTSEDVLKEGDWLDVRSVSRGKGYQGPVKRFGIRIRTRKNKGKRRHVGNMGAVTPARVLPGAIAQAGQMGFQTRTEYNKLVLKTGSGLTPKGGWVGFPELKGSYLIVKGSVPGPKKRLVMLRKGLRAPAEERVETKHISLESQI